jgi:hypothetical protein
MDISARDEIHSSFVERFASLGLKPGLPVTEPDLRRVEEQLKIIFPKSFLEFLIHHGPVFTPGILDLVPGGESERVPKGARFDVQEFFAPDQIVETHTLYSRGGMDEWLVPIAMDCMGNVFGFKREERIARPDDCPVWFFDHDYCNIHQEVAGFDLWLTSFLRLTK